MFPHCCRVPAAELLQLDSVLCTGFILAWNKTGVKNAQSLLGLLELVVLVLWRNTELSTQTEELVLCREITIWHTNSNLEMDRNKLEYLTDSCLSEGPLTAHANITASLLSLWVDNFSFMLNWKTLCKILSVIPTTLYKNIDTFQTNTLKFCQISLNC